MSIRVIIGASFMSFSSLFSTWVIRAGDLAREDVVLPEIEEGWFASLIKISNKALAPGHRVGHPHAGLTTDVFHWLL